MRPRPGRSWRDWGFLAQDVEAALVRSEDPDRYGLRYEQMTPVLWSVCHSLLDRVAALEPHTAA